MKEDNVLISIIVPVYNVENYIKDCLDSILNQTFCEFELILVDDGSTDKSSEICDEYASKDNRISVIHQTNRGLSAARNTGLEKAKGNYIGFVDSDDTITKNMYQVLYDNLIEYQADLSVCSVYEKRKNNRWQIEQPKYENVVKIYSGTELINYLTYQKYQTLLPMANNKLYRRELIEHIRYPNGKIHEDEFIIHELLFHAKKVVISKAQLYEYLIREDSITGSKNNRLRRDKLEALWSRVLFLKEKGMQEQYLKAYHYYLQATIWKCKGIRNGISHKNQFIMEELEYFRKAFNFEKKRHFAMKYKVKFRLFYVSPKLYFCIFEK